mmetsp:Transcript_22374/g.47770  ORF Transcript_22374/g.47770 Transcript_22374/m.47770 type:complete len:250 (+) Transcript_22374:796-1545(+)
MKAIRTGRQAGPRARRSGAADMSAKVARRPRPSHPLATSLAPSRATPPIAVTACNGAQTTASWAPSNPAKRRTTWCCISAPCARVVHSPQQVAWCIRRPRRRLRLPSSASPWASSASRRGPGVARTRVLDVRQQHPCPSIVLRGSSIGRLVGPRRRRYGAVRASARVVRERRRNAFMTALRASAIGRKGGHLQRRLGAASKSTRAVPRLAPSPRLGISRSRPSISRSRSSRSTMYGSRPRRPHHGPSQP